MKKKTERTPNDKEQSQRFVETAKQLGADGKRFDAALKAVMRKKPKPG